MKKCHYCGEEFDEELTVCPACGKEQPENVPVPGEAEASPDTAQEAAAEVAVPVEAAQNASESTPAADAQSAPEAAPVKKGVASASAIALGAAIVLLLAAILAVLILNGKDTAVQPEALASEAATQTAESTEAAETTEATIPADGNPDDVTCKGSYTVSDEEVKAANGEAVATAGDSTLTNGQLLRCGSHPARGLRHPPRPHRRRCLRLPRLRAQPHRRRIQFHPGFGRIYGRSLSPHNIVKPPLRKSRGGGFPLFGLYSSSNAPV